MAETPKKLVHWAMDESMSPFGSPFSDESSMASTSSLQYVNSQLIAHGFTSGAGLCLDGASNADSERVVKCLLGMLSQRVEDMSRTEELTTKLRTLSYDHERINAMHRTATERASNAEKEMNLHKSRLAAANRSLTSTETAHKHTTAELQRTRTSLQAIRTTHQTELKKKEKEIERMIEKWMKLADVQAKLGATSSGIRCANIGVVDGLDLVGKGQGFLEIALEQAENARSKVAEENQRLRRLVLDAVNELQSAVHLARGLASESQEEPIPLTSTALFPLARQGFAGEKLISVLTDLRQSICRLADRTLAPPTSPPTPSALSPKVNPAELEQFQATVRSLREELEQSQQRHAAQTQAFFDQFSSQQRIETRDVGDISMELMTVPAKDEERDRLDAIKKQLDVERRKFTEAAVKLGKDKAMLEAERIQLLAEKRSWQVDQMLADLPPTPQPPSSPARTKAREVGVGARKKSPGKSPTGKSSRKTPKKTRVSRRSSGLKLPSPGKVEPSYETEVMPSMPPPTLPSKPHPPPFTQSLLPTTFVLPPPSPYSTFPSKPLLPSSSIPAIPEEINYQRCPPTNSMAGPSSISIPDPPMLATESPSTPPDVRRPFPVAKPFAPRMVHAYSPAKPSPLSRILMLADSPSNPKGNLDILMEEVEEDMFPAVPSLAEELGLKDDDIDMGGSPLREKGEPNITRKGKLEQKRLTATEKGKGKAEPMAQSRKRTSAGVEKENDMKRMKVFGAPQGVPVSSKASATSGGSGDGKKGTKIAEKTVSTGTRPRPSSKTAPKGTARRVPLDSAEAARGWKG